MGTFLDVEGDPNEVSATGAVLRSMGESLRSKTQAILGDINAVEAQRPWGSDQYGQAFEKTYNEVPEGAEEPLREIVQEGMSHAGERLTKIGDQTIVAMTEYQAIDTDNAGQINQAKR